MSSPSIFESVLTAYGLLPPGGRGALAQRARDSVRISDEAATRAQGVYTGEEQRYLALHARILKMSAAERAVVRWRWISRLFGRLPLALRVLTVVFFLAAALLALPVVLYVLVQVFSSKVACAKMLLLALFTLLVLGARVLLGKVV